MLNIQGSSLEPIYEHLLCITNMTIPDEVDIIVVGGGSCGCVVAGRLANLDHNLQVMLIEAGESNLNVRVINMLNACPY